MSQSRQHQRTLAFPFSLSLDIPADTQDTDPAEKTITVPYDGWVDGIEAAWPGVDAGVGVRLERETGAKLFPKNDDPDDRFEAFTTAHATTLDIRFPVERNEELTAKYVNYDTSNSHIMNFLPNIEED